MAHRSLRSTPHRRVSFPAGDFSRAGLAALGVLALGIAPVAAQSMQICTSRGSSGFMRMQGDQSCTNVNGNTQAQGFAESNSSPDSVPSGGAMGVGSGSTSLAGSSLSAAPSTASPLSSLSSTPSATGGGYDPWRQTR